MASKKLKEEIFKAHWSGFISLNNEKPISVFRRELLENMQNFATTHNNANALAGKTEPSDEVSWRKTLGDSLIYLQNNVSQKEMLNILALENYINREAYITAFKDLGGSESDAVESYKQLILIQEA
ncbi:hypothetical protein HLH17_14410 [Acinetobacter sp. ANC 5380]|uniref:Uncharacterized protein n=1 Tax=Acinetobacter terrae TaxID=2731247 RepID=A0A7Y2WC01_9GAMM|nr:hypothetical protein [Acinetobacter terrae]NNH78814.1 hypothetical protein [Acinetobacter terrae]